ncbi:MAG: radical SAM protein, partial [Chloroflexi bacterium]|nr:radical SAM protein [Chloroflexota bacterium]
MGVTRLTAETLTIHQYVPWSRASGPGVRAVVWVQGCTLGCPGCFNPETHASGCGRVVEVDRLADDIIRLGNSIEGVTISGGEPFQQPAGLAALLRRIRQHSSLSVLLFTGYTWPEIEKMGVTGILGDVDVLIAGRYQQAHRAGRGMTGSLNKTFHFLTGRYTTPD